MEEAEAELRAAEEEVTPVLALHLRTCKLCKLCKLCKRL